ncbi:MAG: GLUG motif-containing protein [Phycisphaerales bacterium]
MAAARNTHIRPAIPLLIAASLFGARVDAQYGGGAGEPNDPYQIWTAEQLNAIGADPNDWTRHFKLMADIDLSAYGDMAFTPIGYGQPGREPSKWSFTGVFDGNDHAISNFTRNSVGEGPVGLFRGVGRGGEIKNLTLIDPNLLLSEGSHGAPLVTYLAEGTVTNCHVRGGRVSGTHLAGGLVAHNTRGRIVNCSATAQVEGDQAVGGLVAFNNGVITGCHAGGRVTGDHWIGGLVGQNDGSIADSYATTDANGVEAVGGLVGLHEWGTIEDCYATGAVGGTEGVGGLIGCGMGSTIDNCYATGPVNGTRYVGGLAGTCNSEISNSYATGDTVGEFCVGGLVGGGTGTIDGCYSTGDVAGDTSVGGLAGEGETTTNSYSTGSVTGRERVGGLLGSAAIKVMNCFATGDVTGDNCVGGLAGSCSWGTIVNCYAMGAIHGPSIGDDNPRETTTDDAAMRRVPSAPRPAAFAGGLVGSNNGSILNCYSTGLVHRTRDAGGLVGYSTFGRVAGSFWDIETSGQSTSDGGLGRTTSQMQTALTFLGWGALDSQDAWTIEEGLDYPRLSWEGKPGVPIYRPYPAGDGTQDAPYRVSTPEELILVGWFPSQWNKCFVLATDIDLGPHAGAVFTIGNSDTPFSGVFDGNDCAISNFRYRTENLACAGLFGRVADPNAVIRNLTLIDPNVAAGQASYVGSLVGYLVEGTVIGCDAKGGYVSGGRDVGGLIGQTGKIGSSRDACGLVRECRCTSRVTGDGGVGGLVGTHDAGAITGCISTGDVSGDGGVGGLVGYNWRGVITNCFTDGTVSGRAGIGGLVGSVSLLGGVICDSYAMSVVTGETSVAGLIGRNGGTVTNCYATGAVRGVQNVGGLVGEELGVNADTIGSFWDVETTGQTESAGGIGLPTAAMKTVGTFLDAGWDLIGETANGVEDIWWILDGEDYPRLFWELP